MTTQTPIRDRIARLARHSHGEHCYAAFDTRVLVCGWPELHGPAAVEGRIPNWVRRLSKHPCDPAKDGSDA